MVDLAVSLPRCLPTPPINPALTARVLPVLPTTARPVWGWIG